MRGRVISGLVLLLSLASTLHPQCAWTPRFSGQFRTTALDVSIDNDFLWVATSYGVQLMRRSGTNVTAVDAVALPGATRVVRANGSGFAYAGSGTRLFVLRRNGNDIQVVRDVDTTGTINDIQIHQGTDLFVATTKGAMHYQLIAGDNPTKSNAIFATSSQNVSSIAINGTNLYTADGDASIEVFNISIPALAQKTDTIDSVNFATAVHATTDNFLYVSDRFGQNTDVISGKTRLARLNIGATSFAPSASRTHFIAGPDRTLRMVDFNVLSQTTELYETQLKPTDGNDNTIHAIARSGDVVYVAAGDMGLVVVDATPLAKPYPIVGYGTGATTASVVSGTTAWISNATGTISEQKIDPTGLSLTQQRSWSGGANALVQDVDGSLLLTSSGATATIWSLTPATPASTSTVTFPASIRKAVLRGSSGIVALLDNGAVWTASGATTSQASVPTMTSLARSGSAIAMTQILEDGKTVIHYYASGDLAQSAQTTTLTGVLIGNVALNGNKAALFLFNGVNLVDLASGVATPIAGSNGVYPTQLAFAGDDVLVIADRTLYVYDDGRTLAHALPLPANAIAFGAAAPYAVIASDEGVIGALYLRTLPQPSMLTTNSFYSKMLADGDRLYLFSRDGVDIYSTASSNAPHSFASIRAANIVDIAAGTNRLYTLSGGSTVTAYSHSGTALGQTTINEGIDTQPLSIATSNNAVWVSISKGCLTGACERKTLVLDPNTLAVTDSFTGQVVDVTTSGSRAYVLTDLPDEIRVVNIADAQHPATLAAIASGTTARSLAYTNGTLYVLGDKIATYAENALTAGPTYLSTMTPINTQQIRIAGSCAAVYSGRSANPNLYPLSFASSTTFDVPSVVRSMIAAPSRLLILTDHSIEVWMTTADEPSKRRGVR